ncbi:hemin ABC transporter ATP-binding subunit [Enterobacter cloacae subsp. cloacae]|nr:hemin ABC transporter ATP-binding subunit [Enterobacter cloacae subsp. cloacae]
MAYLSSRRCAWLNATSGKYCLSRRATDADRRRVADPLSGRTEALIGPNGAGNRPCYACLPAISNPSGRCSLANAACGPGWTDSPATGRSSCAEYPARVRLAGRSGDRDGACAVDAPPQASVIEEVMVISGCLPLAGRQLRRSPAGAATRSTRPRTGISSGATQRPRGWLFLDEPTSALDLYHQQHLLRLLSSLTRRGHLRLCGAARFNLALWAGSDPAVT